MRTFLSSLGWLLLAAAAVLAKPSGAEIAAYDAMLAAVTPGQTTIVMGDMTVPVATVQLWRDRLAGTAPADSASQTGINKWTGGIVYYAFNANVSAAHQTATIDAMGEWATFANLTFTARVAQANYIMVNDVPGLGGGNSSVGMIGGVQQLNIGSTSWNRGTLVHELGHALGLIHEHQRGDGANSRNNFVTINFANVPGGAGDGNFILIPTATGNGAYDFLSVMHYSRKAFAVNATIDTITPLAAYTQFIDLMGNNPDRVLSAGDRAGIAAMYPSAPVLTNVVTNTKDSGPGSLRAAIYNASNATVTFQIPNTDPNFSGGVFTIRPTDRLPAPAAGTIIDATTQTAFTGDTNANGPEVVLSGALQAAPEFYTPGLRLSAANVTVKGFVISGFSTYGVLLAGSATGCTVAGCYVGTNAAGTAAVPNGYAGVQFETGATGNRIGGSTAAARNVISGQTYSGISMTGDTTVGNFIEGNYIGTNAAGTAALPNGGEGITLAGSRNNTIGGTGAGARNVISGNAYRGLLLDGGARGNVVAGNYLGLNAAGTAALPNQAGLYVLGTVNTIGGTAAGAGNVISGNTYQGIFIGDLGSDGNVVAGNFIGLNAAGTAAVPNGYAGVEIAGGVQNNLIGGTTAAARNVISGNSAQGVAISTNGAVTKNNVVAGNYIGLNPAGTAAIPNAYAGVEIYGGSRSNTIGGTVPGARNVISGNASQGVAINGTDTLSNVVAGNYIGTNAAGTAAVPNVFPGVEIYSGAQINIIGGPAPGAGNVISGNGYRQVTITGAGTSTNFVAGNFIGLNAAGTAALTAPVNPGAGVQIFGGAQGNSIGGTISGTTGGRNFICGNSGAGVTISGSPTSGNFIVGNSIGVTPTGTLVANTNEGIALFADGSGGTQNNTIGGSTPGAANLISGNGGAGVAIYNPGTTGNRISGNSITANGGLGIDLWGDGVTANDAGDGDTGPNNLQNFPVLTSAILGTATTVSGTLNSTASTTFRLEFFANVSGDASGAGEGLNFIGATNVTTNASGNATFTSLALPAIVPAGQKISATATDPAGNTSEFSLTNTAASTVTTTDTDGDGLPNAYETANSLSTSVADANVDSDGDGMTNAQEFRAGTNPRNAASILRLGPPATAGSDKTLSLPSLAGITYRIDYADDLLSANHWRTLADQIPGTGAAITITDPGAAALPQRYYRAMVVP